MLIFTIAVFLSSFLLFAVQPLIAKFLLPSFGGAAGVWATCLVCFQVLLLGGYAYAHGLRTWLSPRAQRWTHLCLLGLALVFLPPMPILPHEAINAPVWRLLKALMTSIGLPFFALSATAPLVMEWFRQACPERSPDRLYAFSNAGSLLALLAYPALLEPLFSRRTQAWLWAAGMGLFVMVCGVTAWVSWNSARTRTTPTTSARRQNTGSSTYDATLPIAQPLPIDGPCPGTRSSTHNLPPSAPFLSRARRQPLVWLLWVALPFCGSGLLLALTNQISQDVAPTPLLWVAPLAVYLVTFILCFESPRWYLRGCFIPAAFLSFLALAWLLDQGYLQGFWVQVTGYLGVLFAACMVCHGELYRLRPAPERLTAYYLAISFGGALGGSFVALVAPAIFKTFLETPILAVVIPSLVTFVLWKGAGAKRKASPVTAAQKTHSRPWRSAADYWPFVVRAHWLALGGTAAIAASLTYAGFDVRKDSIYATRSFYGAYRVKEGPTLLLDGIEHPLGPGAARVLLSGQIYHGLQFTNPAAAGIPTTYYCEEGGLGLAFRELPARTNRNIGAVGLGAGTLAAYAQPGDHLRFYELNPDVLQLAQTKFSFLGACVGKVEVVLGDGRLSLEREPPHGFDLLVLDAFSGDSIPTHLLTDEAMRIYQRQLKPEGVMAFHISNSHLDLEPVVRALAERHGLTAVLVPPRQMDVSTGKLPSVWMLLSANPQFFERPGVAGLTSVSSGRQPLLWTDDYSSILPILH